MPQYNYYAMGENCLGYRCDRPHCTMDAAPSSNYCLGHNVYGQDLSKPVVPHYQTSAYEPIDVIHEWQKTVPECIRFEFGCMVKYLGRLGKKDAVKADLEKIRNYAEFALQELARNETKET
jgi:hypothetical protein